MAEPTGKMKPAVSYLRRSTDRQEQSIGDQRREIERFAREHGFHVVREYIDDAVTGTSTKRRPDYRQLMNDISQPDRPFNALLVYDLSRLSRENPFEAMSQINWIRKQGVELISISEPLPGSDLDCLFLLIQQMKNYDESKRTSRRTLRGQVTNAKAGWWCGGAPPFGFDLEYVDRTGEPIARMRYLETGERQLLNSNGTPERLLRKKERYRKSDGDKARLVPSTQERIAIVRWIFQMYVVDGLGYAAIADRLNHEKILSPRNGTYSSKVKAGWAKSTIKAILENRAYAGDAVWNARTSAKFFRVIDERAEARDEQSYEKLEHNDEDDFIIKQNAHAAIIDRDLFEQARAVAKGRKSPISRPQTGRAARSRYLLSGLIRCGVCGHNFCGQPQNRGRRRKDGTPVRTFYYMCGGYLNKGRSVCTAVRIPQAAIESFVLSAIEERVRQFLIEGGEAVVRRILRQMLDGGDGLAQRQQALRHRADAINGDIERLLDCITPDTKEEIGHRIRNLKEERKGLEAETLRFGQMQHNQVNADQVVNEIAAQIGEFQEVFKEGTIEEKKGFARLFVERIDVEAQAKCVRVRIRQFPAPESLDTGNASFRMVAGARCEHQKTPFPPVDVVEVAFERKGSTLVPVAA